MGTKRNTKQGLVKTTVVGVRIEKDLLDALREIAAEDDRSVSGAMRKIVRDHLLTRDTGQDDPDFAPAA